MGYQKTGNNTMYLFVVCTRAQKKYYHGAATKPPYQKPNQGSLDHPVSLFAVDEKC